MRTFMGPSGLLGVLLCSLVCPESWPAAGVPEPGPDTRDPGPGTVSAHIWAVPGLRAHRPSPFSKLSPNFPTCSTGRLTPLPS